MLVTGLSMDGRDGEQIQSVHDMASSWMPRRSSESLINAAPGYLLCGDIELNSSAKGSCPAAIRLPASVCPYRSTAVA